MGVTGETDYDHCITMSDMDTPKNLVPDEEMNLAISTTEIMAMGPVDFEEERVLFKMQNVVPQ